MSPLPHCYTLLGLGFKEGLPGRWWHKPLATNTPNEQPSPGVVLPWVSSAACTVSLPAPSSGLGSAGDNTPRAAAGFPLCLKCHAWKGNRNQEISSLHSHHKPVILCLSTMSSSTQNLQQENTSMSLSLLLCQARLLRGICHLIS